MPLVPLFMDDLLSDLRRPVGLFDQRFGLEMLPNFDPSVVAPVRVGYYRPWRCQSARHSGVSHMEHDKEGFKVSTL
jgi:hypothetical protein